MRSSIGWSGFFILLISLGGLSTGKIVPAAEAGRVSFWRLPNGGIQPQTAVDSKGNAHIIYFKNGGAEGVGNLYYVRMTANSSSASEPIRINNKENSAGSMGTVRTAQLAIGKDDRVHVVWNGLGPKGSNGYPTTYQAYTRLNDAGTAFEPQRDVMTWAKGLDGGGSVAADKTGNVYVTWHALANAKDEAGRAVFITHSSDNGATFTRETQANPEPTGACACCGMRAYVDSKGILYILYRAAGNKVNRDTMLLVSRDQGKTFSEQLLDRWKIGGCPMSTYSLYEINSGILASWETKDRIYFGSINPLDLSMSSPVEIAGSSQKHPFITAASNGQALLVWTEGTGWQRGGSLNWQLNDKDGKLLTSGKKQDAIPVWGLSTAYAKRDGSFVIVY